MVNSTPIAILVIVVVLLVIALLVWRRQKEEKLEGISNKQKKKFFAQWIIGIVGICLIATSNINLLSIKRK